MDLRYGSEACLENVGSFRASGAASTDSRLNLPGLATSSVTPPSSVIQEVKQILAASQADIGGVEYLINERSGEVTYYDINPLSNFVANAVNVVGFDPVSRFVDYLLKRTA